MSRAVSVLTVFAAILLASLPTRGTAQVEHVAFSQPCTGKTGRVIASYSWFVGNAIEREHIFGDLCLDLEAMKIKGVETSGVLTPAYRAPGQLTFHLFPPGHTNAYQETVTLATDMMFPDSHGQDADSANTPPDPDAPGALSTFTWVTDSSAARPLDRIGQGTVWLRGFVGGAPLQTPVRPATYAGYAEHMVGTDQGEADFSGLGFFMEGGVTVTRQDEAGVMLHAPPEVAAVNAATATLTLSFEGNEITGQGRFQAENALLSPRSDRIWKRFDLEAAGVTGQLTGEDGGQMYLLVVWEGTYTDFAGNSYPADSVMTFNARRQDKD